MKMLGCLEAGDVAQWLARASIYAFPARYEPFGLSVLEAARAECALVLGRVPSLLENWAGVARFVDPEDPLELRRAILDLIVDERSRRRMARAAQLRARSFRASAMAGEYARVYGELTTAPLSQEVVPCAS